MAESTTLTLYEFRYYDPVRGKWLRTRYRLTEAEALERFGEGNFERINASREDRVVQAPEQMSARGVQGKASDN
jgi:hypothetical protein